MSERRSLRADFLRSEGQMKKSDDLKNYEPQAFFDLDDDEIAVVAIAVIVLIFFLNVTGAL
jgi:hypothetical protein